MFTIKSVSDEGTYYLVNGWSKHKTFWKERNLLKPNMLFNSAKTAKMSLNKLLKVMSDYLQDEFTVVEIDENGKITERNRLEILTRRIGKGAFDGRYKVEIKEI
jgi:hypothetical protein